MAQIVLQKSFSSSSIAGLDTSVNAFIGSQTVDDKRVFRKVLFVNYYTSGGTFYAHVIYEETIT